MKNDINNIYDGEYSQKYVKKSKTKKAIRSNHKHMYETVLLEEIINSIKFLHPTKVCSICGRIGYADNDPSYYEDTECLSRWRVSSRDLSEKGLNLPKWYVEYPCKFATKVE